jgi:hypothetical protein
VFLLAIYRVWSSNVDNGILHSAEETSSYNQAPPPRKLFFSHYAIMSQKYFECSLFWPMKLILYLKSQSGEYVQSNTFYWKVQESLHKNMGLKISSYRPIQTTDILSTEETVLS